MHAAVSTTAKLMPHMKMPQMHSCKMEKQICRLRTRSIQQLYRTYATLSPYMPFHTLHIGYYNGSN